MMADQPLGKELAPEDNIYDIVDVEEDPLAEPETFADEVDIEGESFGDEIDIEEPEEDLLDFEEDVPSFDEMLDEEDLSNEDLMDLPEEIGDLDVTPDVDATLGIENDLEEDLIEIDDEEPLDYEEPGQLIASVMQTARKFAKYDMSSPNSIRRAQALCNLLEKTIVDGVIADAKHQKLTLSQLRLLDDIQEGVKYTQSFLDRPNKKVIQATRNADRSLFYDPFCATVARVLINAQVQGGKRVQDVFGALKNKFSINEREGLMISQIMMDMGYPVQSLLDGEDMIAQYYA